MRIRPLAALSSLLTVVALIGAFSLGEIKQAVSQSVCPSGFVCNLIMWMNGSATVPVSTAAPLPTEVLNAADITIGTVDQGTPNSAAHAWPMSLVDYGGVNQAAVNASHQLAIAGPVTMASGGVASGAYALGSFAVGAGSDGWNVTEGAEADAANAATDTTPITEMSVLKQISKSTQADTAALTPWTYTNITTAGDTIIKAAPGTFGGVIVDTAGNLSSAVVYDNTTCAGTTIGTFSTLAQGAILFGQGVAALAGICVTTADTTTPANITVLSR